MSAWDIWTKLAIRILDRMKKAQELLLDAGSRESNFMCLFSITTEFRQDNYGGFYNGNK